jgi:hypothetical protein
VSPYRESWGFQTPPSGPSLFMDEWARNLIVHHVVEARQRARTAHRGIDLLRLVLKYAKPRCRRCGQQVEEATPVIRAGYDAVAILVKCHGKVAEFDISGRQLAVAFANQTARELVKLVDVAVFQAAER